MNSCATCGMPLEGDHAGNAAFTIGNDTFCVYDVKDGVVKSAEDIFEGGVQFFLHEVAGGDRVLAERLTRKNMSALEYWKARPFALLDGERATDEEFGAAMMKL